jgi:vacuolar-type H+-ATPase subunit I/STV1
LIGFIFLFLSGCTTSTDPRTGGFFGGVKGISTGTYEERIQEREKRLELLRSLEQEIQHEKEHLQKTSDDLVQLIIKEQLAFTKLENRFENLLSELDHLEAVDKQDQAIVSELKGLIAELQKDIQKQKFTLDVLEGDCAGEDDAGLQLRQLMKQRDDLRKEYDLLVDLYQELAK